MGITTDDGRQPPRRRTAPSGHRLTEDEAAIAKGMLLRGDAGQTVAQFFGVNQARIAELIVGELFPEVPPAAAEDLPPPGPFVRPCAIGQLKAELESARAAIGRCISLLTCGQEVPPRRPK